MASTTFEEKRTLPYSAEQLFDLVADIEDYPNFLPWCVGMKIISRKEEELIADLVIGYKFIRERFRSRVYLERPHAITVDYLSGPLKNLNNRWRFLQNNDGSCTIDFYVEFEFRNPLLKKLVKMFFDEIVRRMVHSFEAQAHKRYGPPEMPLTGAYNQS